MTNLANLTYRGGWITWRAYVIALANAIDYPPVIVMAYLRANPWCAIGQRVCETYNVDYALHGGYPQCVGRDFVEATSIGELRDLASSVHTWEMHLRYLYVIARNSGAYEEKLGRIR